VQKLQLDIETGVGATDYSEVARLESLNGAGHPSSNRVLLLCSVPHEGGGVLVSQQLWKFSCDS